MTGSCYIFSVTLRIERELAHRPVHRRRLFVHRARIAVIRIGTRPTRPRVRVDLQGDGQRAAGGRRGPAWAPARGACTARRLRSTHHEPDGPLLDGLDTVLGPTDAARDLRARLGRREGLVLVGGTSEQVHKLLEPGGPDAPRRLFDLTLIDEASQMDVAHAILPLRGLAEGGTVVLAGDDKQLPPIHRAEPPLGPCPRQQGLAGPGVLRLFLGRSHSPTSVAAIAGAGLLARRSLARKSHGFERAKSLELLREESSPDGDSLKRLLPLKGSHSTKKDS
jgi:hypothetical protein